MSELHPQLRSILDELEAATVRARRLAEPLDDATFARRLSSTAWSAAECIEHLTLTTQAFLPAIDEALARPAGAPIGSDHQFRRDVAGTLLCWILEPPYRMKVKTSSPFVPESPASREAVLGAFEAGQTALAERVRAANGRVLSAKVQSPFSDKVRYTLYSTFRIIPAHERRHCWQAEQTVARLAGT